jgi:AraC family transcriptional regulator of adaptative response/methylated-DNA-[protein]-cysteine methyltransferase
VKELSMSVDQLHIDYSRIEKAIAYINHNFREQPSLEEISTAVNMSPFHFQRLFSEWAGVSPKKFLQYVSLRYAKHLLQRNTTLMNVSNEIGLSSSSRLHDLFINIEGMTPGEFKNGGAGLTINYSFRESPFGNIIIASTNKGVCYIHFQNNESVALRDLKACFPSAVYHQAEDKYQKDALLIFQKNGGQTDPIKLHLRGTRFQIKVWESLLKIPTGALSTYGDIAKKIGNPKAARAVGTAIGANPIAFLIPCHRVIQSNGKFGGYMWGAEKKMAIIGWEAAKTNLGSA